VVAVVVVQPQKVAKEAQDPLPLPISHNKYKD
jgi:hypothetical protein